VRHNRKFGKGFGAWTFGGIKVANSVDEEVSKVLEVGLLFRDKKCLELVKSCMNLDLLGKKGGLDFMPN
jgi:hypothetical protein